MLERAALEQGLHSLAAEKRADIVAILKENDSEILSYGVPEVEMPVIFTHPYAAKVKVNIRKDGRDLSVPVVFRADWDGKWTMPGDAEIRNEVARQMEMKPIASDSAPAATAPQATAPVGPKPQIAAPQQQAPAPQPRQPPLPPGANVREIDLRGKDLFNQGGGR